MARIITRESPSLGARAFKQLPMNECASSSSILKFDLFSVFASFAVVACNLICWKIYLFDNYSVMHTCTVHATIKLTCGGLRALIAKALAAERANMDKGTYGRI